MTRTLLFILCASASATSLHRLRGGDAPAVAPVAPIASNAMPNVITSRPAAASVPPPICHPSTSASVATAMREAVEARFRALLDGLDPLISPSELADKVCGGLPAEGVSEEELSSLMAETAAYQSSMHPDFGRLAARVAVVRLQECTEPGLVATLRRMREHTHQGEPAPMVTAELLQRAERMAPRLEAALRHDADFAYDYFGLRTLQRSYLHRSRDGQPIERPQHLLMRVALCVHGDDEAAVLEAYDLMSRGLYTHATPTLFNAGSPRQQLSSCFLLSTRADSIEGIFDTLGQCARISRDAGGIGLSVSNVRAARSYIRSSGGVSSGLVPMLRVFDATARYVDQGGGKRKGAFAVYLEPWHADVFDFLELRKNHGKEEARARDLFYALWVPDLFMKRVEANGEWSLFCPDECPGLVDTHGAAFEALYERYEREGKARRTVPAQQLWFKILEAQIETGTPYMLYKDAANAKSNQQHLGTIRCSNLCTEIIEYTAPDEVAVCNLASIALPRFVRAEAGGAPGGGSGAPWLDAEDDGPEVAAAALARFDFEALRRVARFVTRSLDRVISVTHYPLPEARNSNLRHRPIGVGVQGLADVFAQLRLPFESKGARALNRAIFETLYYAALEESCELARTLGPHESYAGSPASRGVLQYDMWGVTPSARWDWAALKAKIAMHGLRNSLLLAPMPTASTAQILGNNECFEPYTSNLYARRTLAGEFFVLNPHLQRELSALGLWSRETRDAIIGSGGSVEPLVQLPARLRAVFRTAWEMKQRHLIDMAADRGAFIDQSQSLNLFIKEPTFTQLSSMHFHSWKRGLKTGLYYLRTQPATEAIKGLGVAQQQSAASMPPLREGQEGQPPPPPQDDPNGAGDAQSLEGRAASCALNSRPGECQMCSG